MMQNDLCIGHDKDMRYGRQALKAAQRSRTWALVRSWLALLRAASKAPRARLTSFWALVRPRSACKGTRHDGAWLRWVMSGGRGAQACSGLDTRVCAGTSFPCDGPPRGLHPGACIPSGGLGDTPPTGHRPLLHSWQGPRAGFCEHTGQTTGQARVPTVRARDLEPTSALAASNTLSFSATSLLAFSRVARASVSFLCWRAQGKGRALVRH